MRPLRQSFRSRWKSSRFSAEVPVIPSSAYGRMGTAQHLIWPSLMRVFRTDGLGASSNVALASLSRASRQLTYPVAGYSVFKEQGS